MNPSEKAVLKGLIRSMNDSTTSGWREGDINDWAEWAKRMKATLRNSINVLQEMISVEDEILAKTKTEKDLLP